MIICFKCQQGTKQLMDELLSQGGYKDYSELLENAVHNLSMLDGRIGDGGAVLVEAQTSTPAFKKEKSVKAENFSKLEIPDLFSLQQSKPLKPFPAPDQRYKKGATVSVDQWFFGQYNKLLPLKVTCRALANIGRPVAIQEISEVITNHVAALGDYLRVLDQKRGVKREGALATAFPTREGNDAHKGISRFSNQFVAQIDSQGQVSGLPIDYRFINVSNTAKPEIFLTQEGIEFAQLENGVLDKEDDQGTLTIEEKRFLVKHIADNVPAEDFAFQTIKQCLQEGYTSPEKLDQRIKELNELITNSKDLTPAYISTQRAGTISRMVDLGLIERIKDGIRVNYNFINKK